VHVGIVRFPGSNCDFDCLWAFGRELGAAAELVWHREERFPRNYDLVVIPGGFAFGDYLRAGAIARVSPVMQAVERFAADGGLVLGICNGFQVLTEAGLLPGSLVMNRDLKFLSREVHARVEESVDPWTARLAVGQVLRMPIAHQEGAYTASPEVLAELEANHQVLLRYTAPDGTTDPEWNLNGSEQAIAGIRNKAGNVFGLMPHPERAMEDLEAWSSSAKLPPGDGRRLLECVVEREGVQA